MWNKLKKYFITGVIVLLPVVLTWYLLIFIITMADDLLGRFIEPYISENFGFYFHGLSIIIAAYLIVVVGFFASNYFGKQVYEFFERLFVRLPFFKQVYPALKEMATFLFVQDRKSSFKKVVLVEYPRKGIFTMGFLTSDSSTRINELAKGEMCNIFISSSPSPLTGFTIIVPRKDVVVTDITVDQAFKFIVSGGVVNPGIEITKPNYD